MKNILTIVFFLLSAYCIGQGNAEDSVAYPKAKNVFTKVEVMPEYPGGIDSLLAYIARNISYPEIAKERGVTGIVNVNFVVSKKGKVTYVNVEKGVDPSLDKEAVRVIQTIKGFTPGKQGKKTVKVQFTIPVKFQLAK